MIDTILHYQRLFEYSGNPLDLLHLPYPIFQDLIIRQVRMKKDERRKMKTQGQKGIPLSGKHPPKSGPMPGDMYSGEE